MKAADRLSIPCRARRGLAFAAGSALACAAVLAVALLAASCAPETVRPPRAADPKRVEAHSSGLVSAQDPLTVILVAPLGSAGETAPEGSFRLQPPAHGSARWSDERTLTFTPDRPLARGQRYRVDVDLGLLEGRGAAGSDYFSFSVTPVKQRIDVETLPPRIARDGRVEVEGSLRLADSAGAAAVEASFRSSAGTLAWNHESSRVHRFTITGIEQPRRSGTLSLRWDGSALGGGGRGSARVELPGSSEFRLLGARSLGSGGRGLELAFSDGIDASQDLRGLVNVAGVRDLRYSVSGSLVSLYSDAWPETARISVEPSLRSVRGRTLAQPAAATVPLVWEKPEVRYITKGTILPTTQGLVLPVETMNLSAVVVDVLRVYGDNMLQFLQVNDLSGSSELKRVGEVVWHKRIQLGWKDDWKNRWVRQGLDLSPLIAAQKDGMFQIRITFRRDDIRYIGQGGDEFKDLAFPDDTIVDTSESDSSAWDLIEQWANGWDDYEQYKENPLHPAYYISTSEHDITIRRNVVVSDLGAIVKQSADGTWHVATSDLGSAKPLGGATVTLYSYQRRPLVSALSPASGLMQLSAPAGTVPVFATIQKGAQTSWMKLDEGSTLAIGHFDVGGEKADTGLKGFIYGERGVWRPGDDMHLVFILYNRAQALPAGYPVHFELEDPLGRVVRTGTYSDSVGGFYPIETSTADDAPTGTYVARVRAGGSTFTRSLKVETIMPNRLKISLDWGGAPYLSRDTGRMSLGAAWLTGAQAGALKADVSTTFQSVPTVFQTLPDYVFDDPTRSISGARSVLFQGRLGADGRTDFDVSLAPEGLAPGKLRANILTRVFEPSGVFSTETTSVDYHPYARYVGVRLPRGDQARGMLLTDTDHRVDLALVDRDGKLVKGGGRVEVSLYQLEWRWWWEKSDESLAQRAQELYARPLQRDTVTIGPDGRGSWTFKVKYPNWGRFLVRAVDLDAGTASDSGDQVQAQGHAAGAIVYIDWPGWAGKSRDSGGASAALDLSVGKSVYAPGERASVSFPSNDQARALVTIERAGAILKEEWVPAQKDTTLYQFTVTPDMAPNVYVHVTLVQPHLQTANDLPIRLYGIVPVMVEDPATRLQPKIDAPPSLAPGGVVNFSVRESQGRPMTYTVAVVDEGLLGITRYSAQNPWDSFYKKEASALKNWDLYNFVAGAYSGSLETLLAIGGSDEALGAGNRKPSRFPPVVYFFPPRTLKAGEVHGESFTMGQYIGAVRFMVVAGAPPSGPSGAAFGTAELSVPVKTDLMAQLTAPRRLAPGETASIPATLFSFGGKKRVSVRLSAEGAIALAGPATATLDFAQDGDQTTNFAIKAGTAPGMGRLTVEASSGPASARQSIALEVKSVGVEVSDQTAQALDGGASWKGTISLPGAEGSNTVSVELSRLKPIDLARRGDWLIQYPHGCAEQTTSAAFPQLYLPKAVNLTQERAAAAAANVRTAIQRLASFQTPAGGFAFWPGETEEDDWLSAYVLHFLLESRKEGYDVPAGLVDPALDRLADLSRDWSSTEYWSQAIQAYRLYDLALAGRAEIGAMNRLRDFAKMPTSARFRLAAAYSLAGITDAAADLIKGQSTEVLSYPGLYERTYGSTLRERAVVLDALIALGDLDRALPVYNRLADDLDSLHWYSTQDLGVALAAALPYALLARTGGAPELAVSAGAWSQTVKLDRPIARVDLPKPAGSTAELSIVNRGSAPVYVRVATRGVPPAGGEKAASSGLTLSIRYLGMDGRGIDPAQIPAGTDFIAEAVIRNRSGQDLNNLALSQLFPSGWEIANYRVGEELPKPAGEGDGSDSGVSAAKQAPKTTSSDYEYRDIRDDRVLTYFSMASGEVKNFRIYLNQTYGGSFFLPAATVQAMYSDRWQAVLPGRWLGTGASDNAAGQQSGSGAASTGAQP
ncbi:MAG TPA: MG2 domain-containing protein [Rectinemataceae bacterium]|nr:MG2 domain-containing protein [Rectinemataceae bacterium]